MLLIAGIFMTKYAAGVSMSLHPELRFDLTFALALATVYGAFSGIFFSRGLAMWKVAHQALTARA